MAFKPNNTIRCSLFSKIKDITPIEENSNVIYKIPCASCEKFYVEHTGPKIRRRNYGHKHDQKYYNGSPGSLDKHVLEYGHYIDFERLKSLNMSQITGNVFVWSQFISF